MENHKLRVSLVNCVSSLLARERLDKQIFKSLLILILGICPLLGNNVQATGSQATEVQAGELTVTGTVVSAGDNQPLIGVTVYVEETSNGVITDFDGRYTISGLSKGDVLVFSFIGLQTQKITLADKLQINVSMESAVTDLDEVVAIGYGVQKKKLATGANMNLGGDEITEQNTPSAMDALKGIAPGVNITQSSAAPGAGTKVSIRGIGTTGNSSPTYIVDGVVMSNIDYLSPSDIESIDVFKDAASAAIYGNRGANGIIYVTTKKGKKSARPTVTYDGYYGIQNIYKRPDLLNAEQFMSIMNEQEANSGMALTDFSTYYPNYDGGEGTDWFEEMSSKNAPIQNHSIGISGGSDMSTYSLGFSYFDQEGVFGEQIDPFYKRITFRMNSDHSLWRKNDRDIIKLGQNLTYSNTQSKSTRTGSIYDNDVRGAMIANPLMDIYDADGNYSETSDWDLLIANPIGEMDYFASSSENDNNTASGNFSLIIEPIKDLTWQSRFGFNLSWGDNRSYTPAYYLGERKFNNDPQINQGSWNNRTLVQDNTLTYDFNIDHKHNFTVMAGNSIEKNIRSVSISGQNNNFIFDDWKYAYLSNTSTTIDGAVPIINGIDNYGWGIMSYFGRFSYNLSETWMLSALIRADGSSRFSEDNRWGYFPSVSAGYVLTNANFMERAVENWLEFFKIRASWGELGNESIGNFLYSSTVGYGDTYNNWQYSFSDPSSTSVGSMISRVPNPDLTWETSEQLDIGFDAYVLNSRMRIAFDWYRKDTKDWLVDTDIPSSNGLTTMTINGGKVRNQGVELAISWDDKIGQDFKYGASFSFAHNDNEVLNINNSEGIIHGPADVLMQGMGEMFRAEEGMPIGYFWGLETDGILQNQEEVDAWVGPTGDPYFDDQAAGDFRFVDKNNDGVINDEDKVMIGDPNPDYTIGIQLSADYKGFFFNTTLNGAFGQQNAAAYRNYTDIVSSNYTTDVFDRWHGEGTSDTYPRIDMGSHRNFQYMSDFYIEDADYMKISNLTIGYDFTELLNTKTIGMARLYFSARNLYTFTNYSGLDPEIGYGSDNSWASGIDLGLYPASRTYMVGVSLKF